MSDNLSFERIKYINQKHKDIVFGFIKKEYLELSCNNIYYQIPRAPLIQHIILLFSYKTINSSILTLNEEDKLLSLFHQNNKFIDLGNYSYNLIYKASKDGFNEIKFKKICHGQRNLLILIHTEHNNVFGGYTSNGWSTEKVFELYENDKNAFIFSIRSSQKFKSEIFNVKKDHNQYALRNQSEFYCMFGYDCTIYIQIKSVYVRKITTDYKSYPNDYYLETEGKGNDNEKYSEIMEFEVFKLEK